MKTEQKYTDEQRLEIYEKLEKAYTDHLEKVDWPSATTYCLRSFNRTYCLCSLIRKVANIKTWYLNWQDFPEIRAQKPKTGWKVNPNFWWSPYRHERRLEAVRAAIKLTEREIARSFNEKSKESGHGKGTLVR